MKIGLVLGGGGAKGFAHVGAIRALEEAGIHFSCVAGTSIGALVGAVFAAGKLREFEEVASRIRITDIPKLLSPAWSRSGFFSGKTVIDSLSEVLGVSRIEELPIPFAAVATRLPDGEPVVFSTGAIREAIRASISIPAIFTPVLMNGEVFVDGGVSDPVPIKAVRALGADFVIAIELFGSSEDAPSVETRSLRDIPAPVKTALSYIDGLQDQIRLGVFRARRDRERQTPRSNIFSIVEQTLAANQKQLTAFRLSDDAPDVLIQPPLSNIGVLDFHRSTEGIASGRQAVCDQLDSILAMLRS